MTTFYCQEGSMPSTSTAFFPVQYDSFFHAPCTSVFQPEVHQNDDDVLNELIEQHFQSNRITPEKERAVDNMLTHLHYLLDCNQELVGCEIEVFGSMKNGFGNNDCDVDMTLRWPHATNLQKSEKVAVLQTLLPVLYNVGCYEVKTVFSARVPIIKFHYFDAETGTILDCDISINNELALKNTELIRQYCSWEPHRLPRLGSFVKKWVKDHSIGSAALGTLSSYAYSTMLISYLQSCSPPVLPRLQEEFRSSSDKKEIVDDSDVYFAKFVMTGWTRNRMSVAELFKGFLEYYAKFDFDKQGVQINSRIPLLKVTKKWTSAISIEDPFINGYNLGGSARESSRILRTIEVSSQVFNSSFGEYRQQIEMSYGNITLQELLTRNIINLLSCSAEENTSTPNTTKRLATSPMASPRYEKQPLWIPPATQQIPSVQYNEVYDTNWYNYYY